MHEDSFAPSGPAAAITARWTGWNMASRRSAKAGKEGFDSSGTITPTTPVRCCNFSRS